MPNDVKQPKGFERRYITCTDLELRNAGDDEPNVLVGYAALFDELSSNLGGFQERIAPGAFSKAVGSDVRALFNHNPDLILGRTKSKTLTLREDNRGLYCEITLPNTSVANDLLESINVGNVDQMSFGFRTKKDDWEEVDDVIIRTLIEVDLFDVSPVTFPAYPQTEIAKRSMAAWNEGRASEVPDFSNERRRLDLLAIS